MPNPQAGGPPLVGCPRILIQYIHSFPPYERNVGDENQRLIEGSEMKNEKLRNGLSEKLRTEARTCALSKLVQEVKGQTGQEFISAKRNLQELPKDVHEKSETQIELHEGSADKREGELMGEMRNVQAQL
jgi:hypothetical protein